MGGCSCSNDTSGRRVGGFRSDTRIIGERIAPRLAAIDGVTDADLFRELATCLLACQT
jgi:hypothetical protein